MRIVVLGATGMLGSKVLQLADQSGFDVIATTRSGHLVGEQPRVEVKRFRAEYALNDLKKIGVRRGDVVVNCVGLIKSKLADNDEESVKEAISTNSLMPLTLDNYSKAVGFRILQIATDCVFSGSQGGYCENSPHDAHDVYGKTKSLGEPTSSSVLNLRVSIIGPELTSSTSLFEWFRNLPADSRVQGYTNHFWNGVTTEAFSRVALGVAKTGFELAGVQHLVPGNAISKYELLNLFAYKLGRNDIEIAPFETSNPVDRTLGTLDEETNELLWRLGGYEKPPSIEELVAEMQVQRGTIA